MKEKKRIKWAFIGVMFLVFLLVIGVMVFSIIIYNPIDTPVRKVIFINLDVDNEILNNVKNEFEMKFNVETEIRKESINIQQAYSSERQQYDALKIIDQIKVIPAENERVFVFTSKNMYSGELSFVFSSADKEKNIGVISTFYLRNSNDDIFVERTMKTLLRMFGGTMGFTTTFNKDCVMAFSNSLTELDDKGIEFCGKRKEHLIKLGMLKE